MTPTPKHVRLRERLDRLDTIIRNNEESHILNFCLLELSSIVRVLVNEEEG